MESWESCVLLIINLLRQQIIAAMLLFCCLLLLIRTRVLAVGRIGGQIGGRLAWRQSLFSCVFLLQSVGSQSVWRHFGNWHLSKWSSTHVRRVAWPGSMTMTTCPVGKDIAALSWVLAWQMIVAKIYLICLHFFPGNHQSHLLIVLWSVGIWQQTSLHILVVSCQSS